ncbi:UDP-2,4-diacetamido-2,4,6-trideoxy-beta-L-altropyranose hydrolase [Candidatus Thioglobus sp.]|nr:UDP-2,4-diacetamido-2,4,6-trideoxy-beta-L-altropyranose hydrolase [Candidatus Thioglobus sp.]
MGTGHLMRCLTLANELKQQNHEIVFICRDLTDNLNLFIKYPVLALPKNDNFQSDGLYLNWLGATQEQDAQQTIKAIPKNTDLLIVDSYALDEIWHKKLRPYTKKIMVIDDLADRQFDCDVLLNQNLGTQIEDYKDKVPNDCELLLSCDYALLRPEFSNLREKALIKRQNTKEIKNILISMGGFDLTNKTYEILQDISDNLNIVVVLGGSSPHNKMIISYAKDKENIKVLIDVDNISELMFDADLAIGAGGSTSWERCCLGLPTLLYVSAENQRKIAENLERLDAVKIVDNLKVNLQNILNNLHFWQAMSENAQTVCDGIGVKRIKI